MLRASLAADTAELVVGNSPIARVCEPEEIGYTLAFLLSDESRFTSGCIYSIDGGLAA